MAIASFFSKRLVSSFLVISSVFIAGQSAATAADTVAATPAAPVKIFDELRFGASGSIQSGNEHESGVFPDVQVLFNPFGYNPTADWKDQLTHPRIHVGTSIGTSGSATQVYGGLSWTLTHSNGIFTELGFGGTVHTGNLDDWREHGPMLGCRLLFHEYAGLGYNFDSHWNVMAQIAHSSHANLCDGPNGGMTRAGVMVGYKF
ncbi:MULTISPECIES: acyloxyacyl hydrolase [unclassified Rhizobium]|uniref:acyloxyacyl hydrolase n=1 Tax=unclassified Rhizobium TaxID=2613769 RepID=UPI001FCE8A26|nr:MULTISPECIES: acyloxyacyl hydrolase [unclassified Rhizobium]MDK4712197.1 acyloxyacyl hydrolase [Rhizobium sp. CNPSo 4039]